MIIDRKSPIPQYFQLQTWLREQIDQGVFKPNDQIHTEEELVEITGLARATIRHAINNLVNMGYLTRKRRLGTFVLKKKDSEKKQPIIGLILPDIRQGYAPVLARGVGDEAAKNNYSLILCDTDDLYIRANYHTDRLIENSTSGVIFIPTASPDENNEKIIEKFSAHNIPVVLVDRVLPIDNIDYVTTDNFRGGYELTEYLIKNGHKRIAITLSTLITTEKERLKGYIEALQANGIPVDESLIMTRSGPFNEKRYLRIAEEFFRSPKRATAIFTGHDRIALLFYSVAQKKGIRIPDDVSIVGYDDLHFRTIPLTTIHQPIYEMGQESMRIIRGRLEGTITSQQKVVLQSYMVKRSSVKTIHN